MTEQIRQWSYPKEFRIPPSMMEHELLLKLEKLVQTYTDAIAHEAKEQSTRPTLSSREIKLFADIGTGIWRLRKNMQQPNTSDKPMQGMERVYRHLMSIWDAMTQAGVQIRDHTGEVLPEGGVYSLDKIAHQPTPGITREKVLETVRPSVFYKEQMIQMGQVIIGIPIEKENKSYDNQ
ncbi:MAG: hypothetical protein Q8K98_11745 [Bacteroidota bacterium]|nr:hypothetical protein [Bacteroidota bacterium]